MNGKIQTRDAWLIEKANEHVAAKLTREDILGYCELPIVNQFYLFTRSCRAYGFPDPELEPHVKH